jgi:UDP-galactopyranose mutase
LEHKHFEFGTQPKTVVTKEYPQKWDTGLEPYYPVNTDVNQRKYAKYQALANQEENIHFGERLGAYKYYDMDHTVEASLKLFGKINNRKPIRPGAGFHS